MSFNVKTISVFDRQAKYNTAFLLSIYDKSELENLTESEILELIKLIPE